MLCSAGRGQREYMKNCECRVTDRIKVVHLLKTGEYGGAEAVAIAIIKELQKFFDIIYVSPRGSIENKLRDSYIRYYAVDKISVRTVSKAVKDIKPDIIHAHDYTAGVCAAAVTGKIPVISHIHHNPPWIKKFCFHSVLYALSVRRFSKILAVSPSVIHEYIFGQLMRDKTEIVGNPVSRQRIMEKAGCSVIGDSSAEYDVAFVGRMHPAKAPLRFLHVIYDVKKQIPDVRAVMIGDGELYGKAASECSRLGLQKNVMMKGFMDNPYPIMLKSKILCMPSVWEGYGLAAAESLCLGRPVVCTGAGGLRNIVDNTCGAVCKTRKEMAGWIADVLSDSEKYSRLQKGAQTVSGRLDHYEDYIFCISEMYQVISGIID